MVNQTVRAREAGALRIENSFPRGQKLAAVADDITLSTLADSGCFGSKGWIGRDVTRSESRAGFSEHPQRNPETS